MSIKSIVFAMMGLMVSMGLTSWYMARDIQHQKAQDHIEQAQACASRAASVPGGVTDGAQPQVTSTTAAPTGAATAPGATVASACQSDTFSSTGATTPQSGAAAAPADQSGSGGQETTAGQVYAPPEPSSQDAASQVSDPVVAS